MENEGRQMPEHIKLAYEDAVQNVMFFKRQQWVATNYAVLVYAALFVISAEYFSRTDFARNWLGIFAIATFIFHLYVLYSFDVAISKFREGLDWNYRNYFTGVEQTNLKLRELRPSVDRVTLGLRVVREHQAGLQSFRSMRRIDARRKNASALRLRFSQSLASLRQRLSQAMVRSTTQRRGSTTNPLA